MGNCCQTVPNPKEKEEYTMQASTIQKEPKVFDENNSFFKKPVLNDAARLRDMIQIQDILIYSDTIKQLIQHMDPQELETINQDIINTSDQEYSDFQDKVFLRTIIGDYYCYKSQTIENQVEQKESLLKASRFYNDASILSKQALDAQNAYSILVGLQLSCYSIDIQKNIFIGIEIARQTYSYGSGEKDPPPPHNFHAKKTHKARQFQDPAPVLQHLKKKIDEWSVKFNFP